jgi:hypothetical protein
VACSQFLLGGGDGHAEFKAAAGAKDWGISLQELLRRALAEGVTAVPGGSGRIERPDAEALRPAA